MERGRGTCKCGRQRKGEASKEVEEKICTRTCVIHIPMHVM